MLDEIKMAEIKTAVIILAAGKSARLGRPKQNLEFQDRTLLQRAVETAQESGYRPVVVVLGAVTPQLLNKDIKIVHNEDWATGIASSIKVGINAIKDGPVTSALILLCDQPFVDAGLLNSMVKMKTDTQKAIIACSYNNTVGVPALFDRSLFDELLLLTGDEGAKKVIKDHAGLTGTIPFDPAGIDIDSEADYLRLISKVIIPPGA
jgi:molybdenum cofactor cytidylyltransferase